MRVVTVTLATVAAALACALPAAAAKRTDVGRIYAGSTSQGGTAFLQLSSSKKKVTIAVAWMGDCLSGTPAQQWQGVRDVTLKKGGKFKAQLSDADVDLDVSGTVGAARATGSWHAKVRFRDDAGNINDTCDSGSVHWTVKGSAWGGQQSGPGYPMALVLSRNGQTVTEADLPYEAPCQSGDTFGGLATPAGFPVSRAGSFGDTWQLSGDIGGGQKATRQYVFKGKFGKSTARGTWSVTVTITDATGAVVDTCQTGTLNWTARQ